MMKNENPNQVLASSLNAGAITFTLEVAGYEYSSRVEGADLNWLRCQLLFRSDELNVRRSFLTLAPLQAWVDSLAGFISGMSPKVELSNTEEDFELVIERVGGDLRGVLAVAVWNDVPAGNLVVTLPVTMSGVEDFLAALKEANWVFPERAKDLSIGSK